VTHPPRPHPLPPPALHRSILGISQDEQAAFLLAAHGTGATQLEAAVVMSGPEWAAAQLVRRRTAFSLSVTDPAAQAASLPRDLQHLALTTPLRWAGGRAGGCRQRWGTLAEAGAHSLLRTAAQPGCSLKAPQAARAPSAQRPPARPPGPSS
jgi:hypothetical protein